MDNSENTPSSSDDPLKKVLRFASLSNAFFLAESHRFRRIPEQVRAKSSISATVDLLEMLGLGLNGFSSTCYAFSSEDHSLYGQAKLMQEAAEGRKLKLVRVGINATKLLVFAQNIKQKKIVIDYGSDQEFELSEAQIARVERIALIARIATLDSIFVLEDSQKTGLTMDIDDKNYAVAFLKKNESKTTLAGIREENPGANVSANRPEFFVENILASELDGIIFNPASSSQTILSRQELKLLEIACQVAPRPPGVVSKLLGGLLKR